MAIVGKSIKIFREVIALEETELIYVMSILNSGTVL